MEKGTKVLEIGCGEGGNLLPFAEMGCNTVGIDIAASRIKEAKTFFHTAHAKGTFIAQDIFLLDKMEWSFDIIICHDVLEHIPQKVFKTAGHCIHVVPGMADAIWRASTNLQKQNPIPSPFYSSPPYSCIPTFIKSVWRR